MAVKQIFTRVLLRFIGAFAEKPKVDTSVRVSWEDAVALLYDKQLDFVATVIKVIYSKDKSMRYVVLKDDRGLFSYELQAIYPYEEENKDKFVNLRDNEVSAQWKAFEGRRGKSLFETEEELLTQIENEPEFNKYFV